MGSVAASDPRVITVATRLPVPRTSSRRLIPLIRQLLWLLDDSALAEKDAPAARAALPQRRAPRHPPPLPEGIRDQKHLRRQRLAVKIARLRGILSARRGLLRQGLEHVGAAVAAPGGADLPELTAHQLRECAARDEVLRAVEDRLERAQLGEHGALRTRGAEPGLRAPCAARGYGGSGSQRTSCCIWRATASTPAPWASTAMLPPPASAGTMTPFKPASWKLRAPGTCSWRRMSTVAGPCAVCTTRCG